MSGDPDELADQHLDGEVDATAWAEARRTDPARFDAALASARARRAALAGLARPALPEALRQRILAATTAALPAGAPVATPAPGSAPVVAPAPGGRRSPEDRLRSPEDRRPWWQYALPAALAACLALVVLLPVDGPPHAPSAPAVARTNVPAAADAVRMAEVREQSAEAPPSALADTLADSDLAMRAEPAAVPQAKMAVPARDTAAGRVAPSAPAPASAPGSVGPEPLAAKPANQAIAPAPGPIELQLAWRSATRRAAEAGTARTRQAAADTATAPAPAAEAQAASSPAAAGASAPAEAEANSGERELLITLRNQTVSDLRIAPGGIRLVGVGRDGGAVWRRMLRPESETVVPAGRSLSWAQPMAVLPPGIARLRLEVDGQRSTEITP